MSHNNMVFKMRNRINSYQHIFEISQGSISEYQSTLKKNNWNEDIRTIEEYAYCNEPKWYESKDYTGNLLRFDLEKTLKEKEIVEKLIKSTEKSITRYNNSINSTTHITEKNKYKAQIYLSEQKRYLNSLIAESEKLSKKKLQGEYYENIIPDRQTREKINKNRAERQFELEEQREERERKIAEQMAQYEEIKKNYYSSNNKNYGISNFIFKYLDNPNKQLIFSLKEDELIIQQTYEYRKGTRINFSSGLLSEKEVTDAIIKFISGYTFELFFNKLRTCDYVSLMYLNHNGTLRCFVYSNGDCVCEIDLPNFLQ